MLLSGMAQHEVLQRKHHQDEAKKILIHVHNDVTFEQSENDLGEDDRIVEIDDGILILYTWHNLLKNRGSKRISVRVELKLSIPIMAMKYTDQIRSGCFAMHCNSTSRCCCFCRVSRDALGF